jgi:hypothetical protein
VLAGLGARDRENFSGMARHLIGFIGQEQLDIISSTRFPPIEVIIMVSENRKRILAGIALLVFAIYLGWLGVSYHRLSGDLFNAPRWLFYTLSILVGAGAGLAFLGHGHPLGNLLAVLSWFLFAVVGAWAAFFSPLEELSGGFPMLSPAANRGLARTVFGLGAFLNLGAGIYAGWKFIKEVTSNKNPPGFDPY